MLPAAVTLAPVPGLKLSKYSYSTTTPARDSPRIAATLLMQVLPFYDDGALRALESLEATLYEQLGPRQ